MFNCKAMPAATAWHVSLEAGSGTASSDAVRLDVMCACLRQRLADPTAGGCDLEAYGHVFSLVTRELIFA